MLKKASALARVVTSLEVQCVESLQSRLSSEVDVTDRQWWNVYYDLLLYYMHIADREAFEYLEKSRGIFMKRLVEEVAKICCGDFKDGKQAAKFKANFLENLNLFQNEFGKYQRGHADYLKESLQFQFAKRILTRFGLGPTFIVDIFKHLVADEIILNIPRLLDDSDR
ncbi:unnamed protein product [marine sediment metagenome]|uniref:Uncharacterized protein n=1 Tax=marine sediment metagenome TaxID=412755 RepID=X1SH96_9ZZZZ